MMLSRFLFCLAMLVTSILMISTVHAAPVETFQFKDEVTKVRFQALSRELRCPKCQNQNLADSNSTVASAMRLELYNLLVEGKADIEIVNIMVSSYGEFVLYRPRVTSLTYILWFGPALLILIGIIVVIIIVRKKPATKESLALDNKQQEKLNQLLQRDSNVAASNKASPNETKQEKE
ncbi:cytochrome c-type biogenesis protein CcmH [Colwellia sp. 6_MG-2023]|uniref:cytochrome c-type biogenesis protein n=1 Tax=Colwellia sp. 6_MG-2023 TaxID=3062676 RepID=UPI0026E34AD0|nr:cytochrome c-type biogenesis protein [Colwellia sp. 6_MG-2023]MDO6488937.1 cytochrome c-type biogenesis protein CcmH [Colwellia sp. 6_MG-2023]